MRQVMTDTSASATVVSQSFFLNRVRNVETGTPVFTYYGQHNEDLVAQSLANGGNVHDAANCGARAHRVGIGLEPRSAAVRGNPRCGSSEPASRKRGMWIDAAVETTAR